MRCYYYLLLSLCVQEVKLLSFNILYDNSDDGIDQWSERRTDVHNLLDSTDASVIGLQVLSWINKGVKDLQSYDRGLFVKINLFGVGKKEDFKPNTKTGN